MEFPIPFLIDYPCDRPRNSAESRSQAQEARTAVEVRKWMNVGYLIDVCVAREQLLARSCRVNSSYGKIGLFDQPRFLTITALSDLIVTDKATSAQLATVVYAVLPLLLSV